MLRALQEVAEAAVAKKKAKTSKPIHVIVPGVGSCSSTPSAPEGPKTSGEAPVPQCVYDHWRAAGLDQEDVAFFYSSEKELRESLEASGIGITPAEIDSTVALWNGLQQTALEADQKLLGIGASATSEKAHSTPLPETGPQNQDRAKALSPMKRVF